MGRATIVPKFPSKTSPDIENPLLAPEKRQCMGTVKLWPNRISILAIRILKLLDKFR